MHNISREGIPRRVHDSGSDPNVDHTANKKNQSAVCHITHILNSAACSWPGVLQDGKNVEWDRGFQQVLSTVGSADEIEILAINLFRTGTHSEWGSKWVQISEDHNTACDVHAFDPFNRPVEGFRSTLNRPWKSIRRHSLWHGNVSHHAPARSSATADMDRGIASFAHIKIFCHVP